MSDIQLSDAEWELMKKLWQSAPASVNDIAAELNESTGWHPKTVRTMLIRLRKKGVVKVVLKNNIHHYAPIYTREECSNFATKSFLDRVFDGSITPFVAHFTKSHRLTKEERAALEKLLDSDDKK